MKVLVTGGAGFIGANFVNHWISAHPDDDVLVVDALTYAASPARLRKVADDPRYRFEKADILDYDTMNDLMTGVDVVVHFAAETHVDRSLSGLDAEKLFNRTNLDGTITLLHAARNAGVGRFHHVSTDEVFGDLDYDSPERFHENFPYGPHNPYSVSKAAADFAVRGFGRTRGLPFTISNCTNNYGPYQTPEKMIPRSIAMLLGGKPLHLYTDAQGNPGPNVRDWLYVEDHCIAIEKIVLNGREGETYCVGGNCEMSNYRLVERMLEVLSELTGRDLTMENSVEQVQDRPGHDRRYAMDTKKIETELGWKPAHSFETGFRQTVEWYIGEEGTEWLSTLGDTTMDVRIGQGSSLKGGA